MARHSSPPFFAFEIGAQADHHKARTRVQSLQEQVQIRPGKFGLIRVVVKYASATEFFFQNGRYLANPMSGFPRNENATEKGCVAMSNEDTIADLDEPSRAMAPDTLAGTASTCFKERSGVSRIPNRCTTMGLMPRCFFPSHPSKRTGEGYLPDFAADQCL